MKSVCYRLQKRFCQVSKFIKKVSQGSSYYKWLLKKLKFIKNVLYTMILIQKEGVLSSNI